MFDLVVREAVLSQQSTQEAVLKCYGTCGSLHVERRLDAMSFACLQALLQVLDKLPFARPRLTLVVAETGLECGGFVLKSSVNTCSRA